MYRKRPVLTCFCIFLFSLFLLSECTPDLKAPKPSPGNANFTRTVSMGGDFMAGYQDGALFQDGQNRSIPALLSRSFLLVGGNPFRQALMPDNKGLGLNPKPWKSVFVRSAYLGMQTDCKGSSQLTPITDSLSLGNSSPYLTGTSGNAIQNLAVPFATMSQLFDPSFGLSYFSGNPNPYYNRIAGNVGNSTVYGDAKNINATFFSVWVGMEDIYRYASTGGGNGSILSPSLFSTYLDTLLSGLTANGAKGVIATIPDFRNFPFYTLISATGGVFTQAQADSLNTLYTQAGINTIHFQNGGGNGFVVDDPNNPTHYRQLHSGEYILMNVPTDSIKCLSTGILPHTSIPGRYVLDSAEVSLIDQYISAYNSILIQKASAYGLALSDMHAYFNTVQSGITWDGVNYNTQFIAGGFYSLDGYHPNQKGYALIANEFIKAINQRYKSTVPPVNCMDCNGVLFP